MFTHQRMLRLSSYHIQSLYIFNNKDMSVERFFSDGIGQLSAVEIPNNLRRSNLTPIDNLDFLFSYSI